LLVAAFPIPAEPGRGMTGLLVRDVTQERDLERRRDAFVAVASHELRTPMTTVLGFSELLLRRDLPEATRRQWLTRIHQETQRLTAIVSDLLNVSRIQSGKLVLNREPLLLQGVVDEVLAVVTPTTERHQFKVDVPADTPAVMADRDKLIQVLTNLLDNGIKYSPRGGCITIAVRNEAERQRVVVRVADEGVGIAPEDRERLFTTFHRIRRPETEGVRGTGLGLYIVKGLVALMHGEVWLESELNKGSTFYFTIPTQVVEGNPQDEASG
jgi:signal transduction histidine kinase